MDYDDNFAAETVTSSLVASFNPDGRMFVQTNAASHMGCRCACTERQQGAETAEEERIVRCTRQRQ